jgi:hypothetical protein
MLRARNENELKMSESVSVRAIASQPHAYFANIFVANL